MAINKKIPVIIFIFIVLSSLLYAASKSNNSVMIVKGLEPTSIDLNNFQISTCNAADMGGTCYTKLPELNIVSPKECCLVLGKCC